MIFAEGKEPEIFPVFLTSDVILCLNSQYSASRVSDNPDKKTLSRLISFYASNEWFNANVYPRCIAMFLRLSKFPSL